jgi:hypothetical protein
MSVPDAAPEPATPNIDRTDDTATTQGPTLGVRKTTDAENMECLLAEHGDKFSPATMREAQAILASLHELQRYREAAAKVPEAERWTSDNNGEMYTCDVSVYGDDDTYVKATDYAEVVLSEVGKWVEAESRLERLEDGLRDVEATK